MSYLVSIIVITVHKQASKQPYRHYSEKICCAATAGVTNKNKSGGVGIPEGVGTWDTYASPVLTPSGGHQNTYGWQASGSHSIGMLSW